MAFTDNGIGTGMYMPVAPAQTAALENYLNPQARPAYIVQNPNCCNYNGYYNGGCCGNAA